MLWIIRKHPYLVSATLKILKYASKYRLFCVCSFYSSLSYFLSNRVSFVFINSSLEVTNELRKVVYSCN